MSEHVIWHDLECGDYEADLSLWRGLADAYGGPILDLGAGTGRVTLDLARDGFEVVALDLDARLLEALKERAKGLNVQTVVGDVRDFDLGRVFPLIVAPMQTVQLLGGAAGHDAFLRTVRRHLAPRGVAAIAIASPESFGEELDLPAEVHELEGSVYSSTPISVHFEEGLWALRRRREVARPDGTVKRTVDVIWLDPADAGDLYVRGKMAGLVPLPRILVEQTQEHVGSTVVMLGG